MRGFPSVSYTHLDVYKRQPQEYVLVLFKALGICYLTQFAADSCRDAGESALAVKAEIAGRIAVLLISLPLLSQVASTAMDLIGG